MGYYILSGLMAVGAFWVLVDMIYDAYQEFRKRL